MRSHHFSDSTQRGLDPAPSKRGLDPLRASRLGRPQAQAQPRRASPRRRGRTDWAKRASRVVIKKTPQHHHDAISDSTAPSPTPKPYRPEPQGRFKRFSLDFQPPRRKAPIAKASTLLSRFPQALRRAQTAPPPCAPPRRPAPAPRPPLRPAIRRAKGPGQAESARLRRVRFGFGAGAAASGNGTGRRGMRLTRATAPPRDPTEPRSWRANSRRPSRRPPRPKPRAP